MLCVVEMCSCDLQRYRCDCRLVKAVEDVVDQLLETHNSVWLSSQNVAVRAHKVASRGFIGISCTAFADESQSYESRQSDDFACTDLKADTTDDDDVKPDDRVRLLVASTLTSIALVFRFCAS